MKSDQLLRAILPDVLIDNFDIDRFEKRGQLQKQVEMLKKDQSEITEHGFTRL